MIQQLIDRYKRFRTERFLDQTYQYSYAFVGMGQHSMTNLYPVLHYLGVPLKYICVTSERKAQLIEKKYRVKATTSLDEILSDETIKGVFVATSPASHFSIASRILQSGKSLFIEKPPCQSQSELDTLINLQQLHGSAVAMVALQKRYAPAVAILQKHIQKEQLVSYNLHYLTGNYPEGDALFDLYIHPIDLVCFLFGKPDILACRQVAKDSFLLMLQHPHIIGTLELSTSCTWTSAEENLKVCTSKGFYRLTQMEELTFESKSSSILGIPLEKVHKHNKTIEYLFARNNFIPTLHNNQIHSQGYYNEIQSFITSIEHGHSGVLSDITTIQTTYEVLMKIKRLITESS